MVVFDSNLNFTTYTAAPPGSTACAKGAAHLWQVDFVTADPTGPGWGGLVPTAAPVTSPHHYLDLSTNPTVGPGVVVSGVAIQQQTACANLGASALDPFVPGATHTTTTSYTPGTFSIVAQAGKSNGTGGVSTYQRALTSPTTATLIDSWAAVTE